MIALMNPTPFIVGGLVSGSVYGMAAMGLVFTYKVSRVVNFAYGAIAMFCAYIYWQTHIAWGWPVAVALPAAVIVVPAALALLSERFVYRHLGSASVFAKTAASIGVLLALYGVSLYYWQADISSGRLQAPGVFSKTKLFGVGGVNISGQQFGIVVSVLAVVLLMLVLLRFTRTGLALRAVVVNRDLAELRKINTLWSTRIAWISSYILAGLAGILFASLVGGDPLTLTQIVIYSLSAAAVGGLVSLPLAFAGGIFLGLVESLALGYFPSGDIWSQLRLTAPFFVLLGALLIRSRAFSGRDYAENRIAVLHDLAGSAYARRPNLKMMAARVGLVVLAAIILRGISDSYGLTLVSSGVAFGIIFLSYRVFTATTGMVSFAQAAFAGIGAFTSAGLLHSGWPWPLALLGGGAAAAVAGVILALPTVRLRGIFLALATIAYAMLVEHVVFTRTSFTGGTSGKPLLRPWGFQGDFAYFLLLVAVFCVAGYLCERFQYSQVGLELQAELGSSPGAKSIGIRRETGRLLAFLLSAALAGMGGVFLAAQTQYVSPDTWGLIPAFVWLVLVASGGLGSTGMMIQIGVVVSVLPAIVDANFHSLSSGYVAIFGVLGLLALRVPGGAVGIEERLAARVQRRFRRTPTEPDRGVTEAAVARDAEVVAS